MVTQFEPCVHKVTYKRQTFGVVSNITAPATAVFGDCRSVAVSVMPKNPPPPACPKCKKPMQFLLCKNIGGRRFQCLDCEGNDPLQSIDVAKLLRGELWRPE
jgi:hypothetical protein